MNQLDVDDLYSPLVTPLFSVFLALLTRLLKLPEIGDEMEFRGLAETSSDGDCTMSGAVKTNTLFEKCLWYQEETLLKESDQTTTNFD